jgi:branched-chain amino acid transport system substrate-binding protein
MKYIRRFLVLFLVVILGLAFDIGISKAEEPAVYKIGAILPLTGNLAYIGQEERKGFEMAKSIINEAGGINGRKLEILYGDSKGSAKEGVTVFNKFTEIDKLKLIISSTSPVTNALIPLAERSDIILFAITIQPYVTAGRENIFRIWPDSELEWSLLLKYSEENNISNIGMFYVNAEYGLLAKEYFEANMPKIDGKLEYAESVKIGQTDYRSQIFKIKGINVDAILIICYPGDAIKLIKQLRESGIRTRFLSYLTFTYEFLRKAVKDEAQGTVFTAPAFSIGLLNENGKQFIEQFKKTYDEEPNWNVAFSYDLMYIISTAIKNAKGINIKEIKTSLHNIQDYKGVTGDISIRENNDSKTSLFLGILDNGEIVPYGQKR